MLKYTAYDKAMDTAAMRGIEAASLVVERDWKQKTKNEGHVITARYINSLNNLKSQDGVHELIKNGDGWTVNFGTNVFYSIFLERKYFLAARALEDTKSATYEMFQSFVYKELERIG